MNGNYINPHRDKLRIHFHEPNLKHVDLNFTEHDDVIKWKHFSRYWPFVRGIHRSPLISPHKGQWRGAFMFPLICARINGWVNNREAGDLRRHRAHYEVIVMICYWDSKLTISHHWFTELQEWWRWLCIYNAYMWEYGIVGVGLYNPGQKFIKKIKQAVKPT